MSELMIRVPEILFSPSDIDINESGIPEAIVESINKCPTPFHSLLFENIHLVGGNARIPNFKERM